MEKRKKRIAILIVTLITIITVITMTSGKYIYNSIWNYYLKSKGFYFESDLLGIAAKNNSMLKWDGSDIYFLLKNSSNDKLISDYNISYKITCTVLGEESNFVDCLVNGTDSNIFNGNLSTNSHCVNDKNEEDVSEFSKSECEIGGYSWKDEITTKSNYFNLVSKTATKQIDEVSIKIEAESISPYHKTLIGIFNLNKVEVMDTEFDVLYQGLANYDEITITNKIDEDKCFLVVFDAESYSYDLDTEKVLEYGTDSNKKINQISIKVNKKTSSFYSFYRLLEEKDYSIDDFIIEEKDC